jgi:multicomponent Na+:H+ antiporter subunit G
MNGLGALIGGIVACGGSLFLLLASIGIIRMPDVYNRMQAGTKATTIGTMLVMVGIALAQPSWTGKLLLVLLFLLATNPISSHALARAAHFTGIKLAKQSVRDELNEKTPSSEGDNR